MQQQNSQCKGCGDCKCDPKSEQKNNASVFSFIGDAMDASVGVVSSATNSVADTVCSVAEGVGNAAGSVVEVIASIAD